MTTATRPHSSSAERAAAFAAFAARHAGLQLEPFQARIVGAHHEHRETLAILPRGNGKTSLAAALAVEHLVTTRQPAVYVAAASRDQARVLFEQARNMVQGDRDLSRHVTVRHRELRANGGHLRVLSSDGPRAHGLIPTLALVDELHAHRSPDLYVALRSALGKRSARMLTITTSGYDPESTLGQLRARALELADIERDGELTIARDPAGNFAMLEWALTLDDDLADPDVLKRANPASWVTREWLAEQIASPGMHPLEVARYHACAWTYGQASWLPTGAWQACKGDATIQPSEAVWAGLDVGGERSATALVWATADLRIGSRVWTGDEAVLEAAAAVRELAGRFDLRELAYDPWRFQAPALELQRDGIPAVEFPQSHARMVPASEGLYAAISEKQLTHDGDPVLARHVLGAVAKSTGRGWRLDKSTRSAQIDAAVALAMAVELARTPAPPPTRLLGWL